MSVRLPILYRRENGTWIEVRRLHPMSGSLSLNMMPLSTSSLTVRADEIVPVRSWVQMFGPDGSAGFFRAKSPQGGYGEAQSTIELEHGITEVGDYLCDFAYSDTKEVNEETTLNLAIEKIWSNYKGSLWQFGYHAFTDRVTIDLHYDNVLEAILTVLEQTPNYYLAFNFDTVPWTVYLTARETTVSAEGRLDRNVQSASITYDDTDLATRVYVPYEVESDSGSNEVYASYDADQASISQYGLIEKTLSASGYTKAQADLVAQAYLEKHKKPRVGVQISAIDLSRITNESIDSFAIGKLFRLALPKYGVTIEECITGITYSTLYDNSIAVDISLADPEDAVVSYIKKQESSTKQTQKNAGRGGKSSGGMAKDQGRLYYDVYDPNGIYHTYVEVTDRKISLVVDDETGEINAAGIWLSIDTELKQSHIKIAADIIDIDGLVQALTAKSIGVGALTVEGQATFKQSVYGEYNITCEGDMSCSNMWCETLKVGDNPASWKSQYVITGVTITHTAITVGLERTFKDTNGTNHVGRLVTGRTEGSHNVSGKTIYYLGR